jgi:hypothetical protein
LGETTFYGVYNIFHLNRHNIFQRFKYKLLPTLTSYRGIQTADFLGQTRNFRTKDGLAANHDCISTMRKIRGKTIRYFANGYCKYFKISYAYLMVVVSCLHGHTLCSVHFQRACEFRQCAFFSPIVISVICLFTEPLRIIY